MFPSRNGVRLRRHHSTTKAFVWQCPDLCTNLSHDFAYLCRYMVFYGDFTRFSPFDPPDLPARNTKLCSKRPKKIPPNTKTTKTFFQNPEFAQKNRARAGQPGTLYLKCAAKTAAHRFGLPPMGISPTFRRSAWGRFLHRIARGRCGWFRGSRTRGRGRSGTWSR